MKPGKYQIKFILEKRKDKETGLIVKDNISINMDVTFNGQRLRYYTNYRIDFDKWDTRDQRVKKNTSNRSKQSAAEINRRLTDLTTLVSNIFRHYENLRQFPTIPKLREEIRKRLNEQLNQPESKEFAFFDRFEQYITDAEVSPLRKKQLKSTMNHVKRFNEKITFETLDLDQLKKYLIVDKGKKGKSPKSLNTISGILKRLRAFISYAREKSWTSVNPFENFTIDQELYGDPVYLTKEERDKLFNEVIPIEILAQVRDMFVLQCFIGCRVSDFMKLTKDNIVNDAIEYVPAKTLNESFKKVRIPLSVQAKVIIAKYNIPDGSLVPVIPDQRYNVYLKDLFQFCKLNRPVVRLNPLSRVNETVPLFKLASSHMARRTFVGLLHKVAKNEVIASMTGHVSDSRAFSRYYKIDEDQLNEAIDSIE